jgi:REP element-mobilizing transposase RayT
VTWRLFGSLSPGMKSPAIETGREFAAYDRALDRADYGPMWLADERVAKCVVDALIYGERQLALYELHAWMVMSNHVHVLWTPHVPMPKIMNRIKTFTAREANRIMGREGRFWQRESFDHWVRNEDEFNRTVSYIEENPVNAGLCAKVEDWKWSSACVPSVE